MRRLGTAVVLAAIIGLTSGCGRQVTGLNQPSSNAVAPAGSTIVRFETNGIFDPATLAYYIVINTAGTGMPFYLGPNSNFLNWSYAFEVGGGTGTATKPVLYQFYQNPQTSSGVQSFQRQYADSAYNFQPTVPVANVPGGFQFTFNRCILNLPSPTGSTPLPSPAPSSGFCPPFSFPGLSNIWNINIFTVDKNGFPIDSLEPNGLNDTSFTFTVDVSQVLDTVHTKPPVSTVQNPEAQIYGIEILSSP